MNELTREQILAMPAGRELDKVIAQHVFKAKLINKEINNVTFYKVVDDNEKPLRVTLWDLSTEWAWDHDVLGTVKT